VEARRGTTKSFPEDRTLTTEKKSTIAAAVAAAPALDKVDASYTAVNDVHIFEEQTELVAQYDTSGYRPGQIKALILPEELETRTQAVSVLRRYSQAIGDLAAGKQAQTALRSLSPAPVAPTTAAAAASGKMTPQQMGLILSGLDAALKPYLDRKVIYLPPCHSSYTTRRGTATAPSTG
jgi:hypothetical protein